MHVPDPPNSPKNNHLPRLLVFCLAFSFLIHIIIVIFLALIPQKTESHDAKKTTIVRLIDKSELINKQADYEIDQKPLMQKDQPQVKSQRLAEKNQRVPKEQAPKGEDDRDRSATKKLPQPAPPTPVVKRPKQSTAKKTEKPKILPTTTAKENSVPVQPTEKLPSVEKLTQLPASTLERLARQNKATIEKNKKRDDIETGDTVWLNLQRGLLISFFRRFHNQIEGVWNYPLEATQNGIEGVLLLKITITREGELLDVDLLKSSGSDLLDFEAIQAVYRAAPFGPLPKHYPHPELKINAHFRYHLVGKIIYGRE